WALQLLGPPQTIDFWRWTIHLYLTPATHCEFVPEELREENSSAAYNRARRRALPVWASKLRVAVSEEVAGQGSSGQDLSQPDGKARPSRKTPPARSVSKPHPVARASNPRESHVSHRTLAHARLRDRPALAIFILDAHRAAWSPSGQITQSA